MLLCIGSNSPKQAMDRRARKRIKVAKKIIRSGQYITLHWIFSKSFIQYFIKRFSKFAGAKFKRFSEDERLAHYCILSIVVGQMSSSERDVSYKFNYPDKGYTRLRQVIGFCSRTNFVGHRLRNLDFNLFRKLNHKNDRPPFCGSAISVNSLGLFSVKSFI